MAEHIVSFAIDGADAPADDAPQIEFLCDPHLANQIPTPQPAIRHAPDWFRKLERELGMDDSQGLPALSAKACLPMTDAFALGYVIPLPYDIRLMVPEDQRLIATDFDENCAFKPIDRHDPRQIGAPEPPFGGAMPLKFINPWRIKVPQGYSVLFTQLLGRPELPFFCFSGMVDCDRFATTINFPFVWSGGSGNFKLPQGMPMIQLIPIKRDSLLRNSIVRASTEAESSEQEAAQTRKSSNASTYAREWRVKK